MSKIGIGAAVHGRFEARPEDPWTLRGDSAGTVLFVSRQRRPRFAPESELRARGFEIAMADSADEAAHLLERGRAPRLVFMDCDTLDASEVEAIVRDGSSQSLVPIVLCGTPERRNDTARRAAVIGVLKEPLSPATVLEYAERFCDPFRDGGF